MTRMAKEMTTWIYSKKKREPNAEQEEAFKAGWLAGLKIATEFCLAKQGFGTSDECAAAIMSLRTEVITEPSVVHRLLDESKETPPPTPRSWLEVVNADEARYNAKMGRSGVRWAGD